tara:strand:+ start:68 stop:268 length:201 start_codon:yes stop_codon:yes gene_type:complete
MIFFRKLKFIYGNFFKEDNFLFGLSRATVEIIIMFRNYIPTFFTTKNPVFMDYGFNSVMNYIWLMA